MWFLYINCLYKKLYLINPSLIDSTMTNNESEEPIEVVSVQQWMKNPNLLHSFKCQEVKVNGDLCDR